MTKDASQPPLPEQPNLLGYWLTATQVVEFGHSDYHDGPEWQPVYTTPLAAQPKPVKFKCTVVDDQHPQGIPLEQWGDPPAAQRKPLTDEQRMCSERTAAYAAAAAYADAAYADAAAAYATADAYADADADAYKEGCKVGRAEAFEQIADKIKSLPWENDTKDSFLVWLKEQK